MAWRPWPFAPRSEPVLIRGQAVRSRFRPQRPAALDDGAPAPEGPPAWERVSRRATGRLRLKVTALRDETPLARSIEYARVDGQPLRWQAGQHLTHCLRLDGREYRRPYSLCHAPGGAVAVTVKRLDEGKVSGYLTRELAVGDEVEVLPPAGDFLLPAQAPARMLLLAGGSGITPVRALLEAALALPQPPELWLLTVNRSAQDTIFAADLAELARRHPRLHWLRHEDERDAVLDAPALAALLGEVPPDAPAWLCGPAGLMAMATQVLRERGDAPIFREEFTAAPSPAADSAQLAPQPVVFTRSGREVRTKTGESLLEAGLRAGVALDYSCTVGGCGHCKVQLRRGEMQMDEPHCLSAAEQAQGWRLLCVGRALGPLELEA